MSATRNANQRLFDAVGGTITALEPSPRDPNQRRVRVDGRIVVTLHANEVAALELAVDQPWSEETAEAVRATIERAKANKYVLQLLGRRGYTRRELEARLERRGFQAVAGEVLDTLETHGWVDDRALAETYVEELLRRGPAAPALLVEKLTRRGIDRDLARAVAEEASGTTPDLDAAEAYARKRLRSQEDASPATQARRLASALARRGFDEETVAEVLQRLNLVPGEEPM